MLPGYSVFPRWHFDGLFYYDVKEHLDEKMYQIKLAGALIGPGTVFKKDNPEMRKKFFDARTATKHYDPFDEVGRKIISDAINEFGHIEPLNNQIAIFVVGNPEKAAIHSEPLVNQIRIFYSVVPGDKENIKQLAKNHNKPFND